MTSGPEQLEAQRLRSENTRYRLALDEIQNLARAAGALIECVRPALSSSRPLYGQLSEALEMLSGILGGEYTNRRGEVVTLALPNFGTFQKENP